MILYVFEYTDEYTDSSVEDVSCRIAGKNKAQVEEAALSYLRANYAGEIENIESLSLNGILDDLADNDGGYGRLFQYEIHQFIE